MSGLLLIPAEVPINSKVFSGGKLTTFLDFSTDYDSLMP